MTNPLPEDDAAHLLVVDDDTRIRDLLSRYLTEQGFRVTTAAEAGEARRKLEGLDFDLLIIDVMMPGESGLSLTRSLREIKTVPILMLTALAEGEARIDGLEAGADDYLAKPFNPRELVLRINNILKRGGQPSPPKVEQVVFGPFTFVIARRELKKSGEPVRLTDREREIMVAFAENAGETVPRHELVGGDIEVGERTIDVQINRLRRKIETILPTRCGCRPCGASATG
jgi:two-component system phosphate regulon response regulator OmpR